MKTQLYLQFKKHKSLIPFLIPAIVFALIFAYLPMLGIVIGFKTNLNLIRYSVFDAFNRADWTLAHFQKLFSDPEFFQIIVNTLIISIMKIVILFPLPIVLAIMITEVKNKIYSKSIQSIVYLPHFLSWVVVTGIFMTFLDEDGAINTFLYNIGLMSSKDPILWYADPKLFRGLVVVTSGWKEIGYSAIVYIAAIMAIDSSLYEAAKIDGAGKFKQIWAVTLPGIIPTIVVLFIIRIGYIMDAGFDQVYTMVSPTTKDVGNILGVYIYELSLGENGGEYGLATAAGLFNSVVALFFILSGNYVVKKLQGGGMW